MTEPALPAALHGMALPKILLPYQQSLVQAVSHNALTVEEKSRRIGATWGVGAAAVLIAGAGRQAGGMDVLYIGYNLDMAREFIDACAMWARAFMPAAHQTAEFLFNDGPDKDIKAFRIAFASGFDIVALSSKPRSLRGRQGLVIIDEAAFHDNLPELLKAALALLMWGGRVLVISTHDGEDNAFHDLIQEIRAGRRAGVVLRTTFQDALADGLYKRICLVTGKTWSADAEAAWEAEIRAAYGDAASEELDCIPRRGGGSAIPLALIESCADPDIPVLRLSRPDSFNLVSEQLRQADIHDWCEGHLKPLLIDLRIDWPTALGEDFGRLGDLSILWPLQIADDARRVTPFVVEMRNIPFEQQRQVLFYLIDRLPRFAGAAMDRGGNGQYLAEVALQRYGSRIEGVQLSTGWYLEHMPPFKAAFEDRMITLPRDRDIIGDIRLLRAEGGVIKVPAVRTTGGDNKQRHGDAAVAAALAYYASRRDPLAYGYEAVSRPDSVANDKDQRMRMRASEMDTPARAWREGAW